MAGFEVAGRRLRTEADYKAALRDQKLIQQIRSQVDMEQPGAVITLYSDMQAGKYRFETVVGNDFDDEIYELAEKYKSQGYNKDSRVSARKKREKKPRHAERTVGADQEARQTPQASGYSVQCRGCGVLWLFWRVFVFCREKRDGLRESFPAESYHRMDG